MPPSAFGPGVQAWVGLLSGAYRMSKRNIKVLMRDAFGIELAVGTVSQLERHLSEAVAAAVRVVKESGLPYELNSMFINVEGD